MSLAFSVVYMRLGEFFLWDVVAMMTGVSAAGPKYRIRFLVASLILAMAENQAHTRYI